eukprot:5561110-Amphidinium_carterae.2
MEALPILDMCTFYTQHNTPVGGSSQQIFELHAAAMLTRTNTIWHGPRHKLSQRQLHTECVEVARARPGPKAVQRREEQRRSFVKRFGQDPLVSTNKLSTGRDRRRTKTETKRQFPM